MDVTPGNTPPKRSRAKPTTAAAAPKPERKTLTASRKKPAKETETVATASTEPSIVDVRGLIQTEAFYLSQARGFEPGHELDDWLEAERRVRAQLS